jgi:Protein of unknown function (DUF3800)
MRSAPAGSVSALCVALYHRWLPGRLFMPMAAYLDETGTDAKEPVMIVAGYVASAAAWAEFEKEWRKTCDEAGVSHIHARKIRKGGGIYAHLGRSGCRDLVQRCNVIANRHITFGLSVLLKKSCYRRYAEKIGSKGRGVRNSQFGVCFRTFLGLTAQMVREYYAADADQFAVFYENGAPNAGAAEKMWRELRAYAPELYETISTVAPVDKIKSPPVQAADVLAFMSLQWNRRGIFLDGPAANLSATLAPTVPNAAPPLLRFTISEEMLDKYQKDEHSKFVVPIGATACQR